MVHRKRSVLRRGEAGLTTCLGQATVLRRRLGPIWTSTEVACHRSGRRAPSNCSGARFDRADMFPLAPHQLKACRYLGHGGGTVVGVNRERKDAIVQIFVASNAAIKLKITLVRCCSAIVVHLVGDVASTFDITFLCYDTAISERRNLGLGHGGKGD